MFWQVIKYLFSCAYKQIINLIIDLFCSDNENNNNPTQKMKEEDEKREMARAKDSEGTCGGKQVL